MVVDSGERDSVELQVKHSQQMEDRGRKRIRALAKETKAELGIQSASVAGDMVCNYYTAKKGRYSHCVDKVRNTAVVGADDASAGLQCEE